MFAEVNDRSSSKFKAPVTALVLIGVITFVLFMLISDEGALSALSADLTGTDRLRLSDEPSAILLVAMSSSTSGRGISSELAAQSRSVTGGAGSSLSFGFGWSPRTSCGPQLGRGSCWSTGLRRVAERGPATIATPQESPHVRYGA